MVAVIGIPLGEVALANVEMGQDELEVVFGTDISRGPILTYRSDGFSFRWADESITPQHTGPNKVMLIDLGEVGQQVQITPVLTNGKATGVFSFERVRTRTV